MPSVLRSDRLWEPRMNPLIVIALIVLLALECFVIVCLAKLYRKGDSL
jgi:hypothetical protein